MMKTVTGESINVTTKNWASFALQTAQLNQNNNAAQFNNTAQFADHLFTSGTRRLVLLPAGRAVCWTWLAGWWLAGWWAVSRCGAWFLHTVGAAARLVPGCLE